MNRRSKHQFIYYQ